MDLNEIRYTYSQFVRVLNSFGMGVQQSCTVSVIAGEDSGPYSVRRHPECLMSVNTNPKDTPTMKELTLKSFRENTGKPYLGQREKLSDDSFGDFKYKSYEECEQIALNFGSGLWNKGVVKGEICGIYSENRMEWCHTIDASSLYGFVIASLYDSLGSDSLIYLMRHSRMKSIIVSGKNTEKLAHLIVDDLKGSKETMLQLFVVLDQDKIEAAKEILSGFPIEVIGFDEICKIGESERTSLPKIEPEDMHIICYSSGTTGMPKGVMISHRAAVSTGIGAARAIPIGHEARHLSFLPFAHIFERSAHWITLVWGGRIAFVTDGNIRNLARDMPVVKPTFMAAVPRVMNRYYEGIQARLKKSLLLRGAFWAAWYIKRMCIRNAWPTWMFNPIFGSINALMGGSVDQIIVGGAAMDPVIHEVLQVAMGVPIRTGYGLTEACSGNVISPNDIRFIKPGTVGGPLTNVEVKLDPVDGYDDCNCGEIIIRGQCVASGYLYDEKATEELFYGDDRLAIHTGDVGRWDNNGYLQVVDRLRSIFKLSQGEYVAAEVITQVYEKAPLVHQIFVYGDSSRSCLVAIVVPSINAVARFMNKEKLTTDEFTEACGDNALKGAILRQLSDAAKEGKLFGYQYVKAVYCTSEEWTTDNELLTPTFKLKRKKLEMKYRQQIEMMYAHIQSQN